MRCVRCERDLAYLADVADMAALVRVDENTWRSEAPASQGRLYRPCEKYHSDNVCNWAIPADSADTLCNSCRLSRVIPDLSQPGHPEKWYRLEVAKRRLVYGLMALKLPIANKADDPQRGLAFEFLADPAPNNPSAPKILTGHADGVITVNVAEADDVERERRRQAMHEPYRTLLGHFRHEIGHYYWDRLIKDSPWIAQFRDLFGDERADYSQALRRHYDNGPAPDWQARCVSAYASSHPWEDWAETWAHYLHMADALETAAASGLSLRPLRRDEPKFKPDATPPESARAPFDAMINNWFALTYVLNNLNRGMGLADAYPFVLSSPAIDKLRFIHNRIAANAKPK
jgi:hypothetical protein